MAGAVAERVGVVVVVDCAVPGDDAVVLAAVGVVDRTALDVLTGADRRSVMVLVAVVLLGALDRVDDVAVVLLAVAWLLDDEVVELDDIVEDDELDEDEVIDGTSDADHVVPADELPPHPARGMTSRGSKARERFMR